MAKLTTKERKALPRSDFAIPSRGEGKAKRGGYPIPNPDRGIVVVSSISLGPSQRDRG